MTSATSGYVPDVRRREFLGEAGALVATTTVAGSLASEAAAKAKRQRRRRRAPADGRNVAILGGGMAGLAAAHELVERGFRVTVYERKALGGKARSIPVPGTAAGGRRPLPGEHGFRFFPGFYHHVPDTMRRIPFPGNPNGVHDNLVDTTESKSPRAGGRADAQVFGVLPHQDEFMTPEGLQRVFMDAAMQRNIPPHEAEFFANRLVVFLTSSDERRYGQWEQTSWWDFVRAEGKSEEYRRVLVTGLTRTLVAAKEHVASTRTIGNMAEAFVMNIMGRGNDGALDRVLNAPTNEAWIDPWLIHLRSLGVRFVAGAAVEGLKVRRGRIAGAQIRRRGRKERSVVDADWFISAMPVERARLLLSRDVLALDPSLAGMNELFYDWMNGIQFYLRRKIDLVHGHLTFVDAPWALTALTQGQFWPSKDFARDYGDGSVVDCLSVDISDWDTPGMFNGKRAKDCTREEIAREVWPQIKAHLEDNGENVLPDDILHSWFLDPAIQWSKRRGGNVNDDPLLVNTIGSWFRRPTAETAIPNFFVAGDFVQTNIDLATMEGANESGRAAVNALLEHSGAKAEPVRMFQLYRPPEFEPFKRADAELFKAGRPNAFDRP